tara:strand:+ start:4579 stop:5403 length:825 start_codon:yes stop_codon:yes gene_type:complete
MNKQQEILKKNPFKQITKGIKEIEQVKHERATTGNTYKIKGNNNQLYKISYYDTIEKAKIVEKNVKKFKKIFPKFYKREGKALLFKWIPGKTLRNNLTLKNLQQLGKIYGEVHNINDIKKERTFQKKINKYLNQIKETKFFNKTTINKIEKELKNLSKNLDSPIILEINDPNLDNFIQNKGKIYFVDEEGFNHNIKGRGWTGLYKKLTKAQKQAFLKGYNKTHDSNYFTKDYEKFMNYLHIIISTGHRLNKYGPNNKRAKESLKELTNYFKQNL